MSSLSLTGARTFRSLRRYHNYRLFFSGQVVSLAGSWMQNVALAWLVLSLSRSPLAVAMLLFCRFAPFTIFGLFAGSIVDRFDTRRLVVWTQVAAMLVSAALAVVTLTGTATLPIVYALATIGGIALVLDAPGRQSLTFEMVGPRELPNAVALNSGLLNASRIIGPALAGVLIATAGISACFVLNTVSFLAVLAALVAIRQDELFPVARDEKVTVLAGTREGLRFAWHDRQVRAVLLVVTCVGLVGFNFNTLVPLLASDTLHVDARAFGLLSAAFGLGAFAGAIATASFRHATFGVFRLGALGFSLLLLILAPVDSALLAGVILVGIGASFTLFAANANALVQLAAPDALRGRLVALYLFAFVGLAPLGSLLSGTLVEAGGTRLAFVVAGVVGLAATGVRDDDTAPRAGTRAHVGECPLERGKGGRRIAPIPDVMTIFGNRDSGYGRSESSSSAGVLPSLEPDDPPVVPTREFGAPDTRRVILRIHGDDNILVGSAEGRDNAVQIARDMVRHIEQASTNGEWPQIDERFIRPGAIVSIDVQRHE